MDEKQRHSSQRAQVRYHLLAGRTITALEALNLYGSFRLAAIIYRLRGEGLAIETHRTTLNGKTYATYILPRGDND